MKTYIDLLPEGKKNEIQRDKAFRTIIGQEVGFAFAVIFLLVILVVINFTLKIQMAGIEAVSQNEQGLKGHQEMEVYEEKFKEMNAQLALVSKVQSGHLEWVGALTKLGQLFPDGVYLNGMATKEYRIFLVGKAQKRDDLTKFMDAIKGSDCFTNLNAPLSNLVSKEDVDFQIDFDIKKECLIVK
jgi:Tfp pilus assembly protein PilN